MPDLVEEERAANSQLELVLAALLGQVGRRCARGEGRIRSALPACAQFDLD
jgi:hypothetical protein